MKYLNLSLLNTADITDLAFEPIKQLEALNLWFDHFNGTNDVIMSRVFRHLTLSGLQLANFNVKYINRELFNVISCKNLKQLNLSFNGISDIQRDTFRNLTNLEYLNLAVNSLTGISMGTLMGLNRLKHLYLEKNRISN